MLGTNLLDVLVAEGRVEHLALFALEISLNQQKSHPEVRSHQADDSVRFRALVGMGPKDVMDGLRIGDMDGLFVEEAIVTEDAAVLLCPFAKGDTGLIADDVEEETEKGEDAFVMLELVGRASDVSEWGDVGWVEVCCVEYIGGEEDE